MLNTWNELNILWSNVDGVRTYVAETMGVKAHKKTDKEIEWVRARFYSSALMVMLLVWRRFNNINQKQNTTNKKYVQISVPFEHIATKWLRGLWQWWLLPGKPRRIEMREINISLRQMRNNVKAINCSRLCTLCAHGWMRWKSCLYVCVCMVLFFCCLYSSRWCW